jgi:hypothetical protein
MVMLGRYYGIDTAINSTSVDPKNIDAWLKINKGYTNDDGLYWSKAVEYLGSVATTTGKTRVRFDFNEKTDWNVSSSSPRIREFLDSAQPIVVKSEKFGHYFIIDGALADTNTVKDPRWFNTKTLNDTRTIANRNEVQDYDNFFDVANLFSFREIPKILAGSIHIAIASPVELLITDPQGRKTGKDPVADILYDEIPDAVYGEESGIATSDEPLNQSQLHVSKEIHIQNLLEGNYELAVIGTGSGTYALDALIYDNEGGSRAAAFTGITETNQIMDFAIAFDPDTPENISMLPFDDIFPEANIFFDQQTKTLKIEGADNLTSPAPSVVQNNKTFVIRDAAGNTATLAFEELKQKKEKIDAELKSIAYGTAPATVFDGAELEFSWLTDKKTGKFKQLKQEVEAEGRFEISANYNGKKDQTEITIEKGQGKEKKKEKLTRDGLVLVTLSTHLGELAFELAAPPPNVADNSDRRAPVFAAAIDWWRFIRETVFVGISVFPAAVFNWK